MMSLVKELIDNETAKLTDLNVPFMLTNAIIFVKQYLTYGAWYNNKLVGAFQLRSDGEVSYLVFIKILDNRVLQLRCLKWLSV